MSNGATFRCTCKRYCGGPNGFGVNIPHSLRWRHVGKERQDNAKEMSARMSVFFAGPSTSSVFQSQPTSTSHGLSSSSTQTPEAQLNSTMNARKRAHADSDNFEECDGWGEGYEEPLGDGAINLHKD